MAVITVGTDVVIKLLSQYQASGNNKQVIADMILPTLLLLSQDTATNQV